MTFAKMTLNSMRIAYKVLLPLKVRNVLFLTDRQYILKMAKKTRPRYYSLFLTDCDISNHQTSVLDHFVSMGEY